MFKSGFDFGEVFKGAFASDPDKANFAITLRFYLQVIHFCVESGREYDDVAIEFFCTLGEIRISGNNDTGQFYSSSKRICMFVAAWPSLRIFIVVHYSIVEIVNQSLGISSQPESIKGVEGFLVQKDTVEICRCFKQPETRHLPRRNFGDLGIYSVPAQGLQIASDSLPKTRPRRVVTNY